MTASPEAFIWPMLLVVTAQNQSHQLIKNVVVVSVNTAFVFLFFHFFVQMISFNEMCVKCKKHLSIHMLSTHFTVLTASGNR